MGLVKQVNFDFQTQIPVDSRTFKPLHQVSETGFCKQTHVGVQPWVGSSEHK